ncbi:MAG TPA: sulfatase [Thermoanaerobaculia bacterium]|nr:sulfatase [Thermoanaerobaculia bacterium]
MRFRRACSLLIFLPALLAGCSGGDLPRELSLRDAVAGKLFAVGNGAGPGLRFRKAPERLDLTFDGERRPAVLTAVSPWTWTGRVPEGAELHAGVQIHPEAWKVIEGLRAWVVAKSGEEREVLDVVRTTERERPRWLDFTVDLSRWAGREVTLEFSAEMEGLPPDARSANLVAWSPVRLSSRTERPRPNILFILVDTLRYDHLTPYGYERPTSPEIDRLLAKPGVVVEEAYSQAPWTLPSVASFLTGRQPGEVLGDDPTAYGIPKDIPTLAQALRKLGYETGGFFANQILHEGNGFGRGFSTFYSPPEGTKSLDQPDSAQMNGRVLPWLEAHRNDPFFLYVHYLDPHDPYENPEIVDGLSPFYPKYRGNLTGRHVHGVYAGRVPLERPRQDVAHLTALYDSEIHYVDGRIGELLSAIPPEVLANTLVVLTADHGEELYDHGGWKHGFTLYEDQIHVPLLLRWDARLPAGRRLPGTVRLLDLMPTIVKAAGGEPDPAWEGIDLLPALTGEAPLPRRPAFAQHLMIGPLRAAAVLEKKKLILFNPRTPFAPTDPLQEHLWTQDLARLKRVELYDLGKDRAEKANLAERSAGEVATLQPVIHRQLDRWLPGLRVFASGLPAGSRLTGTIVLDRPPTRWESYFLAEDDVVELHGDTARFDLSGETLVKGFLLEGEVSGVRSVEALLDGRPAPVLLGSGAPSAGGPAGKAALTANGWPGGSSGTEGPALRLWLPAGKRASSVAQAPDPETERRLRALGYIQ